MARRIAYGNAYSENGWPIVDQLSCRWININGTDVQLQIQNGIPLAVMAAFAADFHEHVEPLRNRDSACWTETNSVGTSNHLGGTAMDLNWESHPFRIADAGFDPAKKARLQELLDFYEGTIYWGNNWNSPKDAMHFQMGYGTWDSKSDAPQSWVADFVTRKIRPDGYSTFRRGAAPAASSTAKILANATGLSLARAAEILPAVSAGLRAAECITWPRIAMWLAQVGHESVSFTYTEEIDKTGRYAPYIGRTWIQITWDYNYRAFSKWCFDRGLVPTPDYFVPNYRELADLKWAGIGPAWYWTVSRPQINALCDARDLNAVTYAINGGYNGLSDRQTRYNRALTQGDALLTLLTGEDDELAGPAVVKQIAEIHAAVLSLKESRSGFAPKDEGAIWPWYELTQNDDGMIHIRHVIDAARDGDVREILTLRMAAKGLCKDDSPEFIARATNVLNQIAKNNPEYITAAQAYKETA
ncbi:hypothetical protein MycrhDRAFT_6891 [Mycolicibacterium rhodesiae JS60]|nr:hypothetical protein MycrhDRAFT_6891 [Mycolicibacterium rhodesiae JS60]